MWPYSRADADIDQDDDTKARKAMKRQLRLIERLSSQVIFAVITSVALYAISLWGDRSLHAFLLLFGALLAGLVFGGLLGFIFGIPRFLRQADAPAAPDVGSSGANAAGATQSQKAYRTFAGNTNLEEISDWLTKIIVGLGLVQAANIMAFGERTASWFAAEMGNANGAGGMFVAVVLTATLGGFLFFYIETRTRITLLLTDADIAAGDGRFASKGETDNVLQSPIVSPSVSTGAMPNDPQPQPGRADQKYLEIPFENLRTAEEFAAWGAAQARSNNMQAAVRALLEAVSRKPDELRYLNMLADIRLRQNNPQAALDVLNEIRSKSPDAEISVLRKELLTSLYLPQPKGFTQALATAATLLSKSPEAAADPKVHLWRAAALGQKYGWLMRNNGSDEERSVVRNTALEAVREVVRLAPDASSRIRVLLRDMFDPARGAKTGDDDLNVFHGDQAFASLIVG